MKTIRLPYSKYKNFTFVKQIDYNTSRHYKKICYLYELYNDKKEKKASAKKIKK